MKAADGALIERYYPVDRMPKIGATRRIGGKSYRRLPPVTRPPHVAPSFIMSNSLPRRGDPRDVGAPAYSAKGKPIFTSKKQGEEYVAKYNHMVSPTEKVTLKAEWGGTDGAYGDES